MAMVDLDGDTVSDNAARHRARHRSKGHRGNIIDFDATLTPARDPACSEGATAAWQ